MLSKLVNKFKKHSLQENDLNNIQPQQNTDLYYRSTTTLNSFYSDNNSTLHDSGTESDDDELERLDCMSTREHTSDLTGNSPPNLTSSPPLLSDIESNSWDSTGCESGIVMGDREESSRDVAIESVFEVEPEGVSMHYNTAGGLYSSTSKSKQTGAFRPVTTTLHHSTSDKDSTQLIDNQNEQQQKGIIMNNIGEKRRYENIASKTNNKTQRHSSIVTRLRSYSNYVNNEKQRETLIACRRQPVRLLIHNYSNDNFKFQSQPSKRGRLNCSARPCLDFDKMREQMVISGVGAQEFVESTIIDNDADTEKRRVGSL